jgi:hypothetical protein
MGGTPVTGLSPVGKLKPGCSVYCFTHSFWTFRRRLTAVDHRVDQDRWGWDYSEFIQM